MPPHHTGHKEKPAASCACAHRGKEDGRLTQVSTAELGPGCLNYATKCPLWVRLGSRVTQSRLPLFPQQQTFLSPAVTSEKCQSTKSLRSSPLRGSKSREAD